MEKFYTFEKLNKFVKKVLLLLTSAALVFAGCENEVEPLNLVDEADTVQEIEQGYTDSKINTMRKTISFDLKEAIKNKEFRKYLKNEALKRKDGEPNVYLRDLPYQEVENGRMAVDYLYAGSSIVGNPGARTAAINKLDQIESQDHSLVISIPVNAEDWDPDSFVPPVVYLPNSFEEDNLMELRGFDSNGEPFVMDAKTEPNYPVIVIKKSERVDEQGNIVTNKADNEEVQGPLSESTTSRLSKTTDDPSAPCMATTIPGIPTGLSVSYVSPAHSYISWNPVSNATGYTVELLRGGTYKKIGMDFLNKL